MSAVTFVSILVGLLAAGGTVGALLLARRKRIAETGSAKRAKRPDRIDPFGVGEPWRRHVAAAQSAQRRFATLVGTVQAGPLRDRMVTIGRQIDRGVRECWEIAQRGDVLDTTIRHLNGPSLTARRERASDPTEIASLDNQIASLDRIRAQRDQTDERLRILQTRLGEIVSQAAEVSTGVDRTEALGTAVDDVVTQLEGLRLAFRDLHGTAAGDA